MASNLLTSDGTFASGAMNFGGYLIDTDTATTTFSNEYKATINKISTLAWHVQLNHSVALTQGTTYSICFDAKADVPRTIEYDIDSGPADYKSLLGAAQTTPITSAYQTIKYTFAAAETDSTSRLTFSLGKSDVDVYLDNIGVFEGNNCGSFAAAPLAGTPPIALAGSALIGDLANGKSTFDSKCAGCHGASGAGNTGPALNTNKVVWSKNAVNYSLEGYIGAFMPQNATACSGQCAADVAAYIKAGFNVPSKNVCSNGAGVVCDDFEEANINSRWQQLGINVSLSSAEKFSGTKSLKVSGVGGGYNINGINLNLTQFTSLSKNQYGRLMLKSPSAIGNLGDFTLVEASGPANLLATTRFNDSNRAIYRARIDGAHESFMANYDNDPYSTPLTDCYNHADFTPVPKDTWACVEWRFDATTNTLAYWLNGTKLGISVKDKVSASSSAGCLGHALDDIWSGPSSFDKLHIGVDQYHASSVARTVYIDDVVVDTERVGCPAQ